MYAQFGSVSNFDWSGIRIKGKDMILSLPHPYFLSILNIDT
jgi:hypothetical protein